MFRLIYRNDSGAGDSDEYNDVGCVGNFCCDVDFVSEGEGEGEYN